MTLPTLENPMTSIPQRHINFCREVATLAAKYNLTSIALHIQPPLGDEWKDRIVMSWQQGRHGEESRSFDVTSTVSVRAVVAQKKESITFHVNGLPCLWTDGECISYERICEMANLDPTLNPSVTVAYTHILRDRCLMRGEQAEIIPGTIINACHTGNA
jgi:hypothetical protein